MRCPDCSKMVSYGEPELEVQDQEVDEDGNVKVTVREVLPCGDCGGELKECEFELEAQAEHECKKEEKEGEEKLTSPGEEGFELELDEPESTEDYRPKTQTNKKGVSKPVPMRFQKHYYGVRVTGKVTCKRCGEEMPVEMEADEAASYFNECC